MWDGRMIPQTILCELPYNSSVCWLYSGMCRVAAVLMGRRQHNSAEHQSRSTALSLGTFGFKGPGISRLSADGEDATIFLCCHRRAAWNRPPHPSLPAETEEQSIESSSNVEPQLVWVPQTKGMKNQ